MQAYESLSSFEPPPRGSVVTVGNFDGVHLGHQRLIAAARQQAQRHGLPVIVATFDPHPLAVVAPQHAPPRLTTLAERVALMRKLGADHVLVIRACRKFLALSARAFLEHLAQRCRPRVIVEGPTFTFGRHRSGTVETLRDYAARYGYEVVIVQELHVGNRENRPAVNSSAIRAALRAGDVDTANEMLGRPYRITGRVVTGDRRGRTIGFPTANLDDIPHLLPRQAVYAAVAQLDDGELRMAAVNIGPQPTFAQSGARVEAHLLDYAGELHERLLGLHLIKCLRDQQAFDDVEQLKDQLARDVARTRELAAALQTGRQCPERLPLFGPDKRGARIPCA